MDFENGQVVRRSLEDTFYTDPMSLGCAFVVGPTLAAKDSLNPFEVQQRPRTVNQGIEHLLHLSRLPKEQVARILYLEQRVVVAKTAAETFLLGQSKMKTGVNPTFTDLIQLPFGVQGTRGLCNLGQVCRVHYLRKTVTGLLKFKPSLVGLTGHIFMTIENNHGPKGGMSAHTDSYMAPLRVHNVKEKVINVAIMFGQMAQASLSCSMRIPD